MSDADACAAWTCRTWHRTAAIKCSAFQILSAAAFASANKRFTTGSFGRATRGVLLSSRCCYTQRLIVRTLRKPDLCGWQAANTHLRGQEVHARGLAGVGLLRIFQQAHWQLLLPQQHRVGIVHLRKIQPRQRLLPREGATRGSVSGSMTLTRWSNSHEIPVSTRCG